ncbi:hypothetical protein SEA_EXPLOSIONERVOSA_48 [Mycobacterium phage ExplosioNervosa]|uniref:hypothetical protein n=1 Tax=Mycobacterium phage Pioneer TaxID=1698417 RepID=UPI0006BC8313|nr:hypothetical protein AVV05_gp061 [Mycobacterium phage Pioneer]AVI04254.1 hypothetical protein SEA_PHONNEGUT_48 [Mycobacterium phage Phonnegut]AVI04366.1 hypothetical protein SEA_SCHERZO_48 [Mycobacterium phage Scherzo]AZF93525.1 hypothetical protein SEA_EXPLOSIONERVOSA_48 [Mycobacterium phage ExplosioNervosa]QBI96365.1 hypothetical protein SEA_UGENIE5_45 [Mycobacterium phage Ugenie5]QGJ88699.1 hypothetical protein SEA_BEEMO_48 [Mycobacterium phage Beemo]
MRATYVNFVDRHQLFAGEPMLDTSEGVLIIQYADGTSRTLNWDFVIDFYYMTDEEYADAVRHIEEQEDDQ